MTHAFLMADWNRALSQVEDMIEDEGDPERLRVLLEHRITLLKSIESHFETMDMNRASTMGRLWENSRSI